MPTTPRSNSLYASTTQATPRSARRLTTHNNSTPSRVALLQPLEFPPLPLLNNKRYPERPYAEDQDFKSHLEQDMESVDEAVEILSNRTEELRRHLRESLAHLESERISYETKIRELGEVAKEMVKTQLKERDEMDKARTQESEVHRQQAKLRVRLEGYQQEVKEAMAKLNLRRDLKAKQRQAFEEQVKRNKPEVEFFEKKLGLKIRGKGQNVVQFKFTNLDPTSYSRQFSFDLDVSQSTYSLSSQSPPNYLPPTTVLNPLLSTLNSTRDLYGFIRQMRREFLIAIEVEKKFGGTTTTTGMGGGVGGGEGEGGGDGEEEMEEKEKARERIRREGISN